VNRSIPLNSVTTRLGFYIYQNINAMFALICLTLPRIMVGQTSVTALTPHTINGVCDGTERKNRTFYESSEPVWGEQATPRVQIGGVSCGGSKFYGSIHTVLASSRDSGRLPVIRVSEQAGAVRSCAEAKAHTTHTRHHKRSAESHATIIDSAKVT
jgi:hypothetical protein